MGGMAVTITPPSWRAVTTERLVTCPRTQSRSGEKQEHELLGPEPKLQGFLTLEWKVHTHGKSLNNLGTLRSPLVNRSHQVALCTRTSAWLEIVQAALNMSCFTHRRIWLITEYPLPNQMSYAGSDGITTDSTRITAKAEWKVGLRLFLWLSRVNDEILLWAGLLVWLYPA